MSQYRDGTVEVTDGSQTVVGTGTEFLANVSPGDLFSILGSLLTYQIAAVVDDTHLTLVEPFVLEGSPSSASGQSYWVSTSFTPNIGLPFFEQDDVDTIAVFKRAMMMLDLSAIMLDGLTPDAGNLIVGDGDEWVVMTPEEAREALGVQGLNLSPNPFYRFDPRNDGASTAISDDAYSFACVNILTQTASVNVSQVTNPENGYTHAIRLTQNQASAQRMGFSKILEGRVCKHLRGGNVAFKARIRCSSSQAIGYALLEWIGTEDSPTSDVVNDWTSPEYSAGSPAGFFKDTSLTIVAVGSHTPAAATWEDLPDITGAISGNLNNLILIVWTVGTAAQNVTLDCDYDAVVAGEQVPSDPIRLAPSLDKLVCNRFIRDWNPAAVSQYLGAGQCSSTTAAAILIPLDTEFRNDPAAVTITAATSFRVLAADGSAVNVTAMSLNAGTCKHALLLNITVASGLVAGNATLLQTNHATCKILLTGGEL